MIVFEVHICDEPKFDNKDMQLSKMKASFTLVLDELYASNTDKGLRIESDLRNQVVYVECVTSFKSLMLIPWSHVLMTDVSKGIKCVGVPSLLGKVDGLGVKIAPKQNIFDTKAHMMVANPFSVCMSMYVPPSIYYVLIR